MPASLGLSCPAGHGRLECTSITPPAHNRRFCGLKEYRTFGTDYLMDLGVASSRVETEVSQKTGADQFVSFVSLEPLVSSVYFMNSIVSKVYQRNLKTILKHVFKIFKRYDNDSILIQT